MKRRAPAAAVLLALGVAPALAGCGGDGGDGDRTVPRAQLIAKADARCQRDRARISALPTPKFDPTNPTAGQLPEAATYISKVRAVNVAGLSYVRGLGRPDSRTKAYEAALDAADELNASLKAAEEAAQARDVPLFKAALETLQENEGERHAKAFGFRFCAQG
ncbi:MAG: hypothetical protein ACR2NH_06120 [Solirubrobacteraceae bacterium]